MKTASHLWARVNLKQLHITIMFEAGDIGEVFTKVWGVGNRLRDIILRVKG